MHLSRDVIIFQKSNWKLPFCHIQISFSVYTSIELSDWKIMGWVFRGLRTMCLIPSLINLREAWASLSQEEFCHTQISTSAVIDESCIGVSGDSGRCALSLIIPCNLREASASLSQEALVPTRAPHTTHLYRTSIECSDWKIMSRVFRGLRTMCLIPSLIIPCNLREAWVSLSQEAYNRQYFKLS